MAIGLSVAGSIDESRVWHAERLAVSHLGVGLEQYTSLDAGARAVSRAVPGADREPGTEDGQHCRLLRAARPAAPGRLGHAGRVCRHRRLGRVEQHAVFELCPRCRLGHGTLASARFPAPSAGGTSSFRTSARSFRSTRQTGRGGAAGCGTSCAISWPCGCFARLIGMALPCMLSLEFIRHAPVAGDRVAAMTAEGMADRYPHCSHVLWTTTLLCGFLVLAPGQILSGDMMAPPLDRHHLDLEPAGPKTLRRPGAVDLLRHPDAVRRVGPGGADAVRSAGNRQDRRGADERGPGLVGPARRVRQSTATAARAAIARA